MQTVGNNLSFKTYNSAKVNETVIDLPAFEKKSFYLESRGPKLDAFKDDDYGISQDIVRLTEEKNNLYRSYSQDGDGEILDITLDDDNNQLFAIFDIVAEPGDEIELVLDYMSQGQADKFRSNLVRIHAKENSKVKVHLISMDDKHSQILESTYIKIEEDAQVQLYEYRLGGSHVIANTKADLIGDRSQLDIESIYFAYDEDKLDLHYDMIHHGQESKSNLMINGAMKDQAFKKCKTSLDFVRGSSRSDGSEEEHVILLSDEARSQSVPVLLSGEDDVTGNHAASAGRLDEDLIYYMMSRGLERSVAESMVINASFASAIDAMGDEDHKLEIWNKINEIMG